MGEREKGGRGEKEGEIVRERERGERDGKDRERGVGGRERGGGREGGKERHSDKDSAWQQHTGGK